MDSWISRHPPNDPIVIPSGVRAEWKLEDTVEAAYPGNLLPSRVAWSGAVLGEAAFASVLDETAALGYRARPAEVVRVSKLDRTTRPAADLPFEDQVIYAALIKVLRHAIRPEFVSFTGADGQDYNAFERFPLTQEDARYVLETDVAAFYQYIDHERLAYELIGLSGRAETVEPLTRLLEAWLGTPRGLPQGPTASYVLADIYIAPAARALERAGFMFSRYSDDFRVVGRTWSDVRLAQDTLERALHELGLVVASKKLRTVKIDTYRGYVDRVNDPRLQRATIREAFDEMESEDYISTVVRGRLDTTSDQVHRAEAVFDDQIAAERVDVLSTRLIRRALPILGSAGSRRALPHLWRLLSRYPHLTATVATYIRLLTGTGAELEAVQSVAGWLDKATYRLPWQVGWMLYAIAHAQQQVPEVPEVARAALISDRLPWFARGQAALALAVHDHLPPVRDFVEIYEHAPLATRPDLAAAVLIDQPLWAGKFLAGASDSPVLAGVSNLSPESFREWI